MAKSSVKTIYVAFLRGINVGGHKKVPMADLRKILEKAGFAGVKTFLASGNVIIEAAKKDTKTLATEISMLLERHFGFPIPTIIQPIAFLEALRKGGPFKDIKVTKDTRLYVTFLSEKSASKIKIPYVSPDGAFTILQVIDAAVISVLDLSKSGTPEVMGILEKEFGKNVTTRNWNTIEKILEAVKP